MATDLEGRFICSWIALNSLCGVRHDVLRTPWWTKEERARPSLNKRQVDDNAPRELEWFLWKVCGLDADERILRSVIEDHWPDIEAVLTSRYIMSYYWKRSWKTEEDIEKWKNSRMKIVKDAIGLKSDKEKVYEALCEIVIWRLRTLRNQLVHGCATDMYSKRRAAGESELEAGSRSLEVLVWSFMVLMVGESEHTRYWPPIPYPRHGSPQHKRFHDSWMPA